LIDLHCHLVPEVDDGAVDLKTSLAMARMSVADGVKVIACTPHILPGVYDNTGLDIRRRVQWCNPSWTPSASAVVWFPDAMPISTRTL